MLNRDLIMLSYGGKRGLVESRDSRLECIFKCWVKRLKRNSH